jgi:general L-amino acid transport system permease protein
MSAPTSLSGWPLWRQRLFATPLDTAITLGLALAVGFALAPLVRWGVTEASWFGASRADCAGGGACWVFVRARFGQFMYGFYPEPERWRPNLFGILLLVWGAAVLWRGTPRRGLVALVGGVVLPPLGLWLLAGGWGLAPVETRNWGGLMLTLALTYYAALIALPLAVMLALGRRSRLPFLRLLSIVFIEFWRGVPIITVIFLASLLLPLIMPSGVGVDRLARAIVGLGLVIAAYMAEAFRGGLQAVPAGQAEASAALGLGHWKTTAFIVLPQATRIALPALTNETIALLKNTSLVLVVSIFDLLGIAQAALADPNWVGFQIEAYVFAGAIYWVLCWALSALGLLLERRMAEGRERG